MIRKLRKGFTIVELVIVIAVIAVLTAVLIPTFVHLSKKAKQSVDKSLVSNLNTALKMEEGESGKKPATMHEAVKGLENQGYLVAQLVTKSEDELVYSISENKFFLSSDVTPSVDYWHIDSSVPGTQKWSIYAYGWQGDAATGLTVGFDAGEELGIKNVSYAGSSDVIIRTNSYSTNLSVNTSGSIKHYGNVGKVDIIKVAMSSFHENGNARVINLQEGNLEVEASGNVTLVTSSQTDSTKAKVTNKGSIEAVAAPEAVVVSGVSEGYRTDAAIDPDNTVAIVNGAAKTSLAQADFEDSTVVLLKDYELTTIEPVNAVVIGNMTKFKANITGDASNTVVFKNIHSTILTVGTFYGSLTLDGGLLETDNVNAQNAALQISKGYGTYVFKNMEIAANTNKGLKISKAKSVTISKCEFNAADLNAEVDTQGQYTGRSLAAIDIQEQNGNNGPMKVVISNNKFSYIPQGSTTGGVADSDTAGAIKIKTEAPTTVTTAKRPGGGISGGFESVSITDNEFINCYRDVVVGCNVFQTPTATKEQADMDAPGNVVQAPIWDISDNSTTLSEETIANRGTLTYQATNTAESISEKVGSLKGGCGVWETAKSTRSWVA